MWKMVKNMDIKKRVNEIFQELVEIRREFHMHPELSEKEYETVERICNYLDKWGIEYERDIADTGVVAIIRGKEGGRTVAARADIDALPVVELNDLPFKSVNQGIMHACGHDIHTTIHLGVARLLKEMENDFQGNVKIFFQPAEETVGGAKRMIDEGCLKDPDVEYILALHVTSSLDVGNIEIKYGSYNAATNEFQIKVVGKSSHAAYPEESVDSIVVAGYIITALQTLVSRNISPLNSVVLTLGRINGGTKDNIISGEVTMSGTLRTLDEETRNYAKKRVKEIAENTAKAHGANAIVEFDEDGYPAVINDDEVIDVLKDKAEEILGKDKIYYREFPSMGADDFSYFLQEAKGAYYNLGSGNKEKGWTAPLHSGKFMADEESIRVGVLLQTETLLELLKL